MKVERRRFKRHVVDEDRFEILSRELQIHGRLKDISEGGLSYQYRPIDGLGSSDEVIDILVKNPIRFFLLGLFCTRIYDITDLEEGRTFTGTEIRLRGLEFSGLSEKRRQMLEVLIGNVDS